MSFRKSIFWIHLVSGILSGIVIAIMSVTGIAIAFEPEILHYVDRKAGSIEAPASEDAQRLSLDEILLEISKERPEFKVTSIRVPNRENLAYQFYQGRENLVYANPYTGELRDSQAAGAHHILHTLEEWHRWLGAENGEDSIARLVTGVSNFAFLILCITGIYLWFPRKWTKRMLRPALWFVRGRKGKARDFNWHNVFGFWSLIPLVVIVGTGVVISFGWAHDIVFKLAGEEPPKFRDFRMMLVPPATVPIPPEDGKRLPYAQILDTMQSFYPNNRAISINMPRPAQLADPTAALSVDIFKPASFITKGYTPLSVDPYTGNVLQETKYEDRSPGLRARLWVRFLHTGAAFGLPGKLVAVLATIASLFLVYTGFALSYRRFFPKRKS